MTRRPADPRHLQDGCALNVLTQPHAAPYLLFRGQTCTQKAETLRLLRRERARRQTRGRTLDKREARNN
jgi:hypothetical protein